VLAMMNTPFTSSQTREIRGHTFAFARLSGGVRWELT
jgi:hypothetical protein